MTRRATIRSSAALLAVLMIATGGTPFRRAFAQGGAQPEPAKLLEQADLSRNGWETYEVVTVIRNYQDGELKDEGSFDTYIKGADRTLVKFMNVDVKGQYLLMLEDAMWIYMPNTRKPIRITPLQRLLGNASNGDVARTRWAGDYDATLKGEEKIDGVGCYVLGLAARSEGATYNRVELWVRKEDGRPRKAEIYLGSGKHYKTIFYDSFGTVHGRLLLTQMTIIDRLREGSTTTMTFTGYTPREIPEKWFNKDYMEKLR
ncbi:MAG TPA: outer membrane lipoprotein-sorting protein [Bacteroidota bacterium]|nr:outer membrane lipoprotein-sorting protein [Bacteroidota bacterium]